MPVQWVGLNKASRWLSWMRQPRRLTSFSLRISKASSRLIIPTWPSSPTLWMWSLKRQRSIAFSCCNCKTSSSRSTTTAALTASSQIARWWGTWRYVLPNSYQPGASAVWASMGGPSCASSDAQLRCKEQSICTATLTSVIPSRSSKSGVSIRTSWAAQIIP